MTRRNSAPGRVRGAFSRGWAWIVPVFRARQFWLGLSLGLAALVMFLVGLNHVFMPAYTRQTAEVVVPEIRHLLYDDAVRMIERRGLRPERREQPFNPSFAREMILDQNPSPNASVKPGRRVYLYVNSGTERTVLMPEVRTVTEGVARAELAELGLLQIEVRTDDRPSPFPGTVTRQEPEVGVSIRTSESVTLWVSPGLGDRTVEVPDVRGSGHEDAAAELRGVGLWVDPTRVVSGTITRQEPSPGSLVRVGTEVRLSSVPLDEDTTPDHPGAYEEYEEGIPPFIEVPPGEEPPDLDDAPRDPDRIDW